MIAHILDIEHAPMFWQLELVRAYVRDWLADRGELGEAVQQMRQNEDEEDEEEQQPELIYAIWIGDKTFPAIVFVLGDHDSRSYRNDPCDKANADVSTQ